MFSAKSVLWMVSGAVILASGCATPGHEEPDGLVVTAARVSEMPQIDGKADDSAWTRATQWSLVAHGAWGKSLGSSAKVDLKAVYNESHIAFLISWDDATRDDRWHKPWVWNASKNAYEQGSEQEDAVALAFELSGPFTADMLAPVDAVWDLWTWKATRTDPVGYALDKIHRYATQKPDGKAKEYASRTGAPVWIQRPNDAGVPTQKSHPAPTEFKGDLVAQYEVQAPQGSAADVRAKGSWANGRWTVELMRKLDTGHADDTAFDPRHEYAMAVAVQDRTGDMDKSSSVLRLNFQATPGR